MKKIYKIIPIAGIVMILVFLGVNLYASQSFPGFHSNADCTYCHNDPVFALPVADADVPDLATNTFFEDTFWEDNQEWTFNYVPTVKSDNRFGGGIVFFHVQMLMTETKMIVQLSWEDDTFNTTGSTADKAAIIFNIDIEGFTIGDFLGDPADQENRFDSSTGAGKMKFWDGGTADMWYWNAKDVTPTAANASAVMDAEKGDWSISSTYDKDETQDVTTYAYFGTTALHDNPDGYYVTFVRDLTTDDDMDVQFKDGEVIQYAIAYWDGEGGAGHYTSFDKYMVVGETIEGPVAGGTSSFTAIMVVVGLLAAIPIVVKLRKK
ncbi:MAG: ethylbenzene dehydrogenase-related protein [Candidatus Hodarchaeales archaeon]